MQTDHYDEMREHLATDEGMRERPDCDDRARCEVRPTEDAVVPT